MSQSQVFLLTCLLSTDSVPADPFPDVPFSTDPPPDVPSLSDPSPGVPSSSDPSPTNQTCRMVREVTEVSDSCVSEPECGEECRMVRELDCRTVQEQQCYPIQEMIWDVIQVSQGTSILY